MGMVHLFTTSSCMNEWCELDLISIDIPWYTYATRVICSTFFQLYRGHCPDIHPINRAIYGLVFFSRGPRYVLVEGGALAKHTPEAYPEAYPRSIPRSKPPKWRSFLRGCWWLLFGDLGLKYIKMGRDTCSMLPLGALCAIPPSIPAVWLPYAAQVGWRQLRCWLAAVASLWQPIPFASTSFWCWLAVVAPV